MSKKINIVLCAILIIAVASPFFQLKTSSNTVYISGVCLVPVVDALGTLDAHFELLKDNFQSAKYLLLILIPLAEIILMGISLKINDKHKVFILECISYILNFCGLIFTLGNISSFRNYTLGIGYYTTVSVYTLIFAIKFLEYLIQSTPPEDVLWGKKYEKSE